MVNEVVDTRSFSFLFCVILFILIQHQAEVITSVSVGSRSPLKLSLVPSGSLIVVFVICSFLFVNYVCYTPLPYVSVQLLSRLWQSIKYNTIQYRKEVEDTTR